MKIKNSKKEKNYSAASSFGASLAAHPYTTSNVPNLPADN